MENKKNFYNEEKFEALEMNQLEEIQGGGLDLLFNNIRDIFLDIIGKDDSEKK